MLPVISLAELDTSRQAVVDQFRVAATSTGFFQLVDHGVAQELSQRIFEASERFFNLPLEDKMALERDEYTNRGYEVLGGQTLYGQVSGHAEQKSVYDKLYGITDLKEGLMIGRDGVVQSRYLHGSNRLPTEERCPGLRQAAADYYDALLALTKRFMPVVALAMGQREDLFDAVMDEPISSIRLLHYPPQELKEGSQQMGASPHTDFGFVTFLAAGEVPGLEVFHAGAWHKVEPRLDAFICNIGDCLAAWSGDSFVSSLHRVTNQSGTHRFSIPFFLEGNNDVVATPLGGGESFKIEDFIKKRYNSTYVS